MGLGNQVAIAVWAMTGVCLALLCLRLYTRIRIVRFVGTEDYLFGLTGLFLVAFAATLHISVHYGLGRSLWILDLDDSSNAIFWSYVANTFAVLGNAMAKLSMGFFLLRVVQVRFQKLVLWILIVVTAGTSIALVVMLWNQTTPRKASWDPLRTPGVWNIQIQPMSIGLGGWSSACDFFFAIFPWLFIWSLRMPRREKIMLAGSMSLGVIAGACGVVRSIVLARLQVTDYTLNFAPYFIWAGAEIAVAMVCLAVPTLRPLYQRHRGSTTIDYTSRAHPDGVGSDPELPRFTMLSDHKLPMTPQSQWSETPLSPQPTVLERPHPLQPGSKPSISSPRRTVIRDSSSSHTMVEHWQPDPAPFRSLSLCPPSPDGDVDPDIKLPLYSTEGTILRPPSSVYTKQGRRDSVDDILGLYNERSRSRGCASSLGRNQHHEPEATSSHGDGIAMPGPPPGVAITTTHNYDIKYYNTEEQEEGETKPNTEGVMVDYGSYNDSFIDSSCHDRISASNAEERVEVNLDNWPLRN